METYGLKVKVSSELKLYSVEQSNSILKKLLKGDASILLDDINEDMIKDFIYKIFTLIKIKKKINVERWEYAKVADLVNCIVEEPSKEMEIIFIELNDLTMKPYLTKMIIMSKIVQLL